MLQIISINSENIFIKHHYNGNLNCFKSLNEDIFLFEDPFKIFNTCTIIEIINDPKFNPIAENRFLNFEKKFADLDVKTNNFDIKVNNFCEKNAKNNVQKIENEAFGKSHIQNLLDQKNSNLYLNTDNLNADKIFKIKIFFKVVDQNSAQRGIFNKIKSRKKNYPIDKNNLSYFFSQYFIQNTNNAQIVNNTEAAIYEIMHIANKIGLNPINFEFKNTEYIISFISNEKILQRLVGMFYIIFGVLGSFFKKPIFRIDNCEVYFVQKQKKIMVDGLNIVNLIKKYNIINHSWI